MLEASPQEGEVVGVELEEVWFVTGSSRGLGRSTVAAALGAGRRVVATARNVTTLADLVERYPDRLLALPLDVTDWVRAQEAVDEAVAHFGRLDVVVNNAGYADIEPIESVALSDFVAQVDAVFYGTVHVTRAALPVFRAQRSGFFIQIASIGGRVTAPGLGAYQAAKFAVEGFSGVLRQEVSPLGIRVTVAEPGSMRTEWAGASMRVPAMDEAYADTVGAFAERTRASGGRQPIDPDAVARVLVDLSEHPAPPLHLPLGVDAVEYARRALEENLAQDAEWADVGRSVDFAVKPAPAGEKKE